MYSSVPRIQEEEAINYSINRFPVVTSKHEASAFLGEGEAGDSQDGEGGGGEGSSNT